MVRGKGNINIYINVKYTHIHAYTYTILQVQVVICPQNVKILCSSFPINSKVAIKLQHSY